MRPMGYAVQESVQKGPLSALSRHSGSDTPGSNFGCRLTRPSWLGVELWTRRRQKRLRQFPKGRGPPRQRRGAQPSANRKLSRASGAGFRRRRPHASRSPRSGRLDGPAPSLQRGRGRLPAASEHPSRPIADGNGRLRRRTVTWAPQLWHPACRLCLGWNLTRTGTPRSSCRRSRRENRAGQNCRRRRRRRPSGAGGVLHVDGRRARPGPCPRRRAAPRARPAAP
jgi:hypothetical protein